MSHSSGSKPSIPHLINKDWDICQAPNYIPFKRRGGGMTNKHELGTLSLAWGALDSSCHELGPQELAGVSLAWNKEVHPGLLSKPCMKTSGPACQASAPRPRIWDKARLAQSGPGIGRCLCNEGWVPLPATSLTSLGIPFV